MKSLRNLNFGEYLYSFFIMKVDFESFGERMSNRDLSLFFHEYVHFLQNLTTIFGISKLSSDHAMLKHTIDYIRKQPKGDIKVPVIESALPIVSQFNDQTVKHAFGDNDFRPNIQIQDVFVDSEFPRKITETCYQDSVFIRYGQSEFDAYIFGANEICESMAYSLERLITKDYEKSSDYPYRSAELLIEFLYPEYSELYQDLRYVVALCDYSLMFSNPGYDFFQIVKFLKENKITFKSPIELLDFLDANWITSDIDTQIDLLPQYVKIIEETRYNFHHSLTDPCFESFHHWIDCVLNYCISLRTHDRWFWQTMIECGDINQNVVLYSIKHNLGTPLMETKQANYFYQPPFSCENDDSILYFKVLHQINSILREGKFECELKPWCKNGEDITDQNCDNSPWNKTGKCSHCHFEIMWKYKGLEGYIPTL